MGFRVATRPRWNFSAIGAGICLLLALAAGISQSFFHSPTPIGVTMRGQAGYTQAPQDTTDLNCWLPSNYLACTVQSIDAAANQQLQQFWQVDFLLDTPASLTYAASNSPIQTGYSLISQATDTLLVLVLLISGFLILVDTINGGRQRDLMHALPRIILAFLGAHVALLFCQEVIDLNNALTDPFRATVKSGALLSLIQPFLNQSDIFLLMLLLVYLLALFIFAGQMLYRLAFIGVLIILAPLGMLCFALPQTQAWGRWWINSFVATTLTQFVQVVALAVGITLMNAVGAQFISLQSTIQLLWGIGFLYLAMKIPSLLRTIGQTASGLSGELAGGAAALVGLVSSVTGTVTSVAKARNAAQQSTSTYTRQEA